MFDYREAQHLKILFSQFKNTQKQNKQTNNYFYIIINQVNTLIDQYNPTGLVPKHLHRFIDAAALLILSQSYFSSCYPIRSSDSNTASQTEVRP